MFGIPPNHRDESKAKHDPDEDHFTADINQYLALRSAHSESYLESQNSLSPYHFTAKRLMILPGFSIPESKKETNKQLVPIENNASCADSGQRNIIAPKRED
jgi:hypothetical protein